MFKIMREISPEISKIYLDVAKCIFKTLRLVRFWNLYVKIVCRERGCIKYLGGLITLDIIGNSSCWRFCL